VRVNLRELQSASAVLTPRQLDVLKLRMAGYGYRDIARALGISTSTARIHLDRAYQLLALELERDGDE
jgi:DNA-binding CsgD family transcriptional regulator